MNYFSNLWKAIGGRGASSEVAGPIDATSLQAKAAALQLELSEAKRQIETMRSEYALLQSDREHASTSGSQEQLERMCKRLAGPLSNLAALADMAEAGAETAGGDFVQLVRSLEKELSRAGLERIGRSGEETVFDTALHQRMSGGTVHAGTAVSVRVPGFRLGPKILMKAMVTAREVGRG